MHRVFTPTSVLLAGTIIFASSISLSGCRNVDDRQVIPEDISIVRLGDIEVPALQFDFVVDPDREVEDLWSIARQPCNLDSGWPGEVPLIFLPRTRTGPTC
jgi:hypothetical protein